MANLRRRSARLSKSNTTQSSARKTPAVSSRLDSLVEREETPDVVNPSIDGVLATPTTSRTIQERLCELDATRTPQTEPRPGRSEMNPKTVHRSTAKAPDSGLKLGFSDIKDKSHDTPTKSAPRQSIPTASTFEFQFSSDLHLSRDAQQLMDSVREDAARIKSQMLMEKAIQEQKDQDTNKMFGAGRRIAQPKGRAGRFSDVHMAQFKKMDSIANHASAFRARPGFAAPTEQSLKRSPSKAGLDEVERPRTAGKTAIAQPRKIPPPIIGRPNSVSPFKSIPVTEARNTPGPAKRARQSEYHDVTDSRPTSTLPIPKASTLHSPTKSSMARTSQGPPSSETPSMIPRSNSTKSIKAKKELEPATTIRSPSKATVVKPLPAIPRVTTEPLYPNLPPSPSKTSLTPTKEANFTSKLPTLSGLRSILRGNPKSNMLIERPGTPKRPNTTAAQASSSARKVDFTPSVKSRHAVKLAADSPSPAKIRRDTPYKTQGPMVPYDSSAYIIEDDGDQNWEDDDSGVVYPSLPSPNDTQHVMHTFTAQAKDHARRESTEFKSIFTDLHPTRSSQPVTSTSSNARTIQTNAVSQASKGQRLTNNPQTRPRPSTIRQVRMSDESNTNQSFAGNAVANNLSGQKRGLEYMHKHEKHDNDDDTKENRDISIMPNVPGGWNDTMNDDTEDESTQRAGKRVRMSTAYDKAVEEKPVVKKPNAAREAAAKNAKERKGRGVLSLSRLNMLSRPKSRG